MCAAQVCSPKACNSFFRKRTRPGFFCCLVGLGTVAMVASTVGTELRFTTYLNAVSSRNDMVPVCHSILNQAVVAKLSGFFLLQLHPCSTRVASPGFCEAPLPSAQLFSTFSPVCSEDAEGPNSAALSFATPHTYALSGQQVSHLSTANLNTCSPISLLQMILADTMCSADISILQNDTLGDLHVAEVQRSTDPPTSWSNAFGTVDTAATPNQTLAAVLNASSSLSLPFTTFKTKDPFAALAVRLAAIDGTYALSAGIATQLVLFTNVLTHKSSHPLHS